MGCFREKALRNEFWLVLCELPRQSPDQWVEAQIGGQTEEQIAVGDLCKSALPTSELKPSTQAAPRPLSPELLRVGTGHPGVLLSPRVDNQRSWKECVPHRGPSLTSPRQSWVAVDNLGCSLPPQAEEQEGDTAAPTFSLVLGSGRTLRCPFWSRITCPCPSLLAL